MFKYEHNGGMMADDEAKGGTVARAFGLLAYVAAGGATGNLSALAREVGINRITAARLLATLEDEGMLEALPQGGHRIGVRFLGLAADALGQDDLIGHGRRLVALLSKQVSWSGYMVELDGPFAVYLVKEVPQTPLVSNIRPGSRIPAYLIAPGRVLMARLPRESWRGLYEAAQGDPRGARVTFEEAEAMLLEARGLECCWSFGKFEQGIDACAAPVFDASGEAVAAISVAGGSYLLAREPVQKALIEEAVLDTARRLSGVLGAG
jgi:DNA-binding IclR family transcriptional regulator